MKRYLWSVCIAWLIAASGIAALEAGASLPAGLIPPGTSIPGLPPGGDLGDLGDIGGGFGEGPALAIAQPADGATDVAVATPLMLIFTTAMSASQEIAWSSNIDPAKVSYSWGFGNMFLTIQYAGGWPGNATVNYTLNPPGKPPGFKDVTGVALPTTEGSFSTGAGSGGGDPTDPCDGGEQDDGQGVLSISKQANYVQTSSAAPELDTSEEIAVAFQAVMKSPTNNPVTAVSLAVPGGRTVTLTNFFGSFMFFETFSSPAEMDSKYPAGNYTATMQRTSGGSQTITLSWSAGATVPTPRLSNFEQLAGFNAAQDFVFRWDPFTGAGAQDMISFEVHDTKGKHFHAPDPCVPRELKVTDTSITLPKGTLSANTGNSGTLSFQRVAASNTNALPDISAFAMTGKSTSFEFAPSSEPATPPEFTGIERQSSGLVILSIKTQAGARLRVDSSTDLLTWLPVQSVTAASAQIEVTHMPVGTSLQFYRAVLLP